MKRLFTVSVIALVVSSTTVVEARPRVVVRAPRAHVVVRTGFPIHRALPDVIVRTSTVPVAWLCIWSRCFRRYAGASATARERPRVEQQ